MNIKIYTFVPFSIISLIWKKLFEFDYSDAGFFNILYYSYYVSFYSTEHKSSVV